MKKNVVICDPYSSGAILAEELARQNYNLTAVLSTEEIPPTFRELGFNRDLFSEILCYETLQEKCLERLREIKPAAVFCGSEIGVILSARLSKELNLAGDSPETAAQKRDKYLMSEILRKKNILSVEQVLVTLETDLDEAMAKINKFPVIIKPRNSGGTDGVRLCHTREDVYEGVNNLLNTTNALNLKNQTVLMQQYLGNREYALDMVVLDDIVYTTAIWKYDKTVNQWGDILCYSAELIESVGEEQEILINYAKKVLDALDFTIGPAHCEIMLTDKGPILVEVAARLHGERAVSYSTISSGKGQLEYTIEAYLDQNNFIKTSKTPYEIKKHCKICFLLYNQSGILEEINHIDEIKQFPSFYELYEFSSKTGIPVRKTSDICNIGGIVTLIHEDKEQLERDYKQIRQFNDTDLFLIKKCDK